MEGEEGQLEFIVKDLANLGMGGTEPMFIVNVDS